MRFRFFSVCSLLIISISCFAKEQENHESKVLIDFINKNLPGFYQTIPNNKSIKNGNNFTLSTIIVPLKKDDVGYNLFYLEEFKDNNPKMVVRRRIYSFWIENDKVKLKLFNPRKELKFPPLDLNYQNGIPFRLDFIKSLSSEDFYADRDVCILHINKFMKKVVARMGTHKCNREETWIDYELIIGKDGMWTCFARRNIKDDSLFWLQSPDAPCLWQLRN